MKSISALLLSPLRPFILLIVSSPFSPFPISITLLMWHTLLSSSFIYKNISFSRLSNLSCPYISSASFCPRLSKEFFNNRMLLHNSDHYANLSFIHTIKKKCFFVRVRTDPQWMKAHGRYIFHSFIICKINGIS